MSKISVHEIFMLPSTPRPPHLLTAPKISVFISPLHSPLASNSTKASIPWKKERKSFRRRRKWDQKKYEKRKCEENGKTATGAFLTRLSTLWIFYSTNELPIMFIGVGFLLPSCSQLLCAFLKMFLFGFLFFELFFAWTRCVGDDWM